ncbi:MAG TPA: hypothetical protein VKT49_24245 [Bryobacteraceae bacterium]|nr:hypothetical protein [Bryobacteraceae bacterium]
MGTNTWLLMAALLSIAAAAQGQRGGAAATGKAAAPFDLTGYWVSIVNEDWRYRMVTPTSGDYQGVPMNVAARQVADAWDPANDEAAGEQCKSYGAPALLRVPERLHITWEDDQTLREETDAGMQTRLFHFGDWKAPGGPRTWQGDSVARWETHGGRGGPQSGTLRVTTTHLRAGYLRKNGVPYSEDATVTEYYDLAKERNGDVWLVVTITVEDPKYLTQQFVISSQFKKQADGAGWDPTPCSSRW